VRLVQVTIPAGKRETVLDVLDEEGIDYVLTDETSRPEPTAVVSFPLPTGAVEEVLDRLREVGIDDRTYTVILDAETVVSRNFEQLRERYAEEEKSEDRIAREEIHARAEELAPAVPVYVVMTVVSAVIATAGLLLDSPAVVVGSMVIAPLIGPAMAAAVGSVVDDQELFRRGVKLQLLGLSVAVLAATVFAVLIRYGNLLPPTVDVLAIGQIRSRLSPDLLSLVIALGAGAAGAVSLASGVSAAIVGVMIAAALVPPIGVIGIGIAWGLPSVVVGSGVLLALNLVSINLAALAVFWYQGYRPEQWFRADDARATTFKRAGVLLAVVVLLSVVLGAITYSSIQSARAEREIRDAVERTVEASTDGDGSVGVLETRIERNRGVLLGQPRRVVVTVGIPSADVPPGLSERIDRAIDRAAGRDVPVQVRYLIVRSEGRSATRGSAAVVASGRQPGASRDRDRSHRSLDSGRQG